MRIAQIAPLWASIPPEGFGGIERVVHELTEELVRRGHEVTLFASGDSKTKAKLIPGWPVHLFKEKMYGESIPWENNIFNLLNISEAYKRASDFDIIHAHDNEKILSCFFTHLVKTPTLITAHNPLPVPQQKDYYALLTKHQQDNWVTISNAQRRTTDLKLNYVKTIYNGIDVKKFEFNDKPGKYLVWLGRFTVIKGTHLAIEIAKKTGLPLVIAGRIDETSWDNREYFHKKIKPEIDGRQIKYLGEVNEEKIKLFSNALALLNPILWEEPFGLTMIEAMACGTPVIAFKRGSVPEIIVDKKTGFIVEDSEEAIEAIKKLKEIKRSDCRKHVENNFTTKRMVDEYEKIYRKLTNTKLCGWKKIFGL